MKINDFFGLTEIYVNFPVIMKRFCFIAFVLLYSVSNMAQTTDSTAVFKKRKTILFTAQGLAYAGSMSGLYFLWYRPYRTSQFHFFNDNDEWLLVDKAGHALTAYQIGIYTYKWYRWTNISEKRSVWLGGLTGFTYLTTVEIFDGFSDGWGFSYGDMLANTMGAFGFITQQLYWNEQRISLKFSFHRTPYAATNTELLGANLVQESLKDYNGQTYWMSVNINSFTRNKKFIPWLNIALGYGAEGMYNAKSSSAYRQYYLSLDVDWRKIRCKSKFLGHFFNAISFIKIPAPTLFFANKKFGIHYLYF